MESLACVAVLGGLWLAANGIDVPSARDAAGRQGREESTAPTPGYLNHQPPYFPPPPAFPHRSKLWADTAAHRADHQPLMRLDLSGPKATCQSFCAAVRAEDFDAVVHCCARADGLQALLLDCAACGIITQHHFDAAVTAAFGASHPRLMSRERYTDRALTRWLARVENAQVSLERNRAVLTSASDQSLDLELVKQSNGWKLLFLNLNQPDVDETLAVPPGVAIAYIVAEMAELQEATLRVELGQFKTCAELQSYMEKNGFPRAKQGPELPSREYLDRRYFPPAAERSREPGKQ